MHHTCMEKQETLSMKHVRAHRERGRFLPQRLLLRGAPRQCRCCLPPPRYQRILATTLLFLYVYEHRNACMSTYEKYARRRTRIKMHMHKSNAKTHVFICVCMYEHINTEGCMCIYVRHILLN